MIYVYIFIGIVTVKFLYNLMQYLNNFRLYKIWKSYFEKKSNNNAITYTKDIENHLKQANVKDTAIPILEPLGLGQIATATTTAFDNIFAYDKRPFSYINHAFLEARGVYRSRMIDSFKISYWIKLIVFLPKNIISYLGLNADTIFTKIFQIIFWVIDSILIVVYQDKITIFVKNTIDYVVQLFK